MNTEKKITPYSSWFLSRPKTSGILVFLFIFAILDLAVMLRYQVLKKSETNEMTIALNIVEQNIEQSLKNSYATTIGLALTIDDNGEPKNFQAVGRQLLNSNNFIDAVQLVPNGVIKYTYPMTGNEAATNFNILKSPVHRGAALKAIASKKMYYVGPVELKQGGLGIVGRLPVYKKDKFWGFSAVIIKFSRFVKSTGIETFHNQNFYFQFSKRNIETQKEEFFLPGPQDFKSKLYKSVSIPEGDWKLYVIRKNDLQIIKSLTPIFLLAMLMASICGVFVISFLKRPSQLQNQVKIQTDKLLKNELFFKSIFEHAGLGITHTNSIKGNFIDANDKFCELIGYTQEEIKKITFMMITHPDDLDADLKKMELLKEGKLGGFSLEKRYFHKKGTIIWVNITVTPLWEKDEMPNTHMTIVEDITKRKEYEFALVNSQNNIESLINTIDGIVWEGYPDKPGVTFISKKSEAILGYKSEEWLENEDFWYNHMHPEDRDWVTAQTSEYSKKRTPHVLEYRMIDKSGNTVWLQDIVSIFVENDNSIKFRGILIDITQNKQFELELNNTLNLVTQQNKRLLDFSYIVSHNLRSHTSNIQSLATLIEESDDETEKTELLALLKSVSDTLHKTMDNLNEVVSIQTQVNPVIESLELQPVISKTLEILSNQIKSSKAKIINNVPGSVTVNYNPAYLDSVILNFILNAVRYHHPERNPVIELNSYEEKEYIVLEIKDNGIGIDLKKNGKKLFGMYKTFTNNPESKGIGLFISKNQIDTMQGKVTVESEINVGTTFKIYFKK
ncbi:sensor histidine kinase [Flavobacterium humi]|uniref:histidine kinase n=1 Tax=Flavobacterium humi TaxID=2562683 RepID=A0A4Z0LBW8_9FLAO|nr:PAS domain S-box protein [Flavobacterium humi]TGD59367.1 PAS domain S-box protein [Flavobacterium humi]